MVKKTLSYFLLSFLLLFQFSCDDKGIEKQKCFYEVKFIMEYCPVKGAVFVRFTEKNTDAMAYGNSGYSAALLNVPEHFRVRDKVFYITYHPAKDDEIVYYQGACPAIFGPEKVLIVDSISSADCDK